MKPVSGGLISVLYGSHGSIGIVDGTQTRLASRMRACALLRSTELVVADCGCMMSAFCSLSSYVKVAVLVCMAKPKDVGWLRVKFDRRLVEIWVDELPEWWERNVLPWNEQHPVVYISSGKEACLLLACWLMMFVVHKHAAKRLDPALLHNCHNHVAKCRAVKSRVASTRFLFP